MKLELSDLNNGSVYIGDKLRLKTKFLFDEDQEILWSGLRLLTSPPCGKDLQIAKQEVFSRGGFEAGEYIRDKSILIKNNVVPTIEKRDLGYEVQLLLRKENPLNRDEDIIIQRNHEVVINDKESRTQPKQNPISFSLSGLHIELKKDVFKPGETIKVNYTSEGLRELEIRLMQKANLVCYCEPYGKNCQNVEELPAAIAGDVKTKSPEEGYLLLKIPEIAEPSHNYLWEPSEKEHWGLKYGDYCEWNILVIGRRKPEFGREPIKFELPITIVSKPISDKKKGVDLFSGTQSEAPSLFGQVSSKFQKRFKILSIEKIRNEEPDINKYQAELRNISGKDLEGVTVKISGLQEGLFETAPILTGISSWNKDEVKTIAYETKQKITGLTLKIEDNSQKVISIQKPIKPT
jgi:hypothetical protein